MELKPFRAYRFAKEVVGDVGACIAPPYDVISPQQQRQLYEKSKYNIVRIIKGKTYPSDNHENNQYIRAAGYLQKWITNGVLRQDSQEIIYAYVQDFKVNGSSFQRLNLIALARLEDFGDKVRPHEQTLTGPMLDRLKLKRATSAKFGLPFLIYDDPEQIADKMIRKAAENNPLMDFQDEDKVRHRLFAISRYEDIENIRKMMVDKSCIIADGHHRYTTALTYSRENSNPAAKYQMIAFSNTSHEGLLVLATHRLVGNLTDFKSVEFVDALKKDFDVTEYRFGSDGSKSEAREKVFIRIQTEFQANRNAFAIYCGGKAFYVAIFKDKAAMDSAAPRMSQAWRSLDVAVLQKLVLEKTLKIGQKQMADGTNVEYVKDHSQVVDDFIETVDTGKKQIAFFLNPTRIEQIQQVTAAGERMPQKSTFFYPKIFTGLTINTL